MPARFQRLKGQAAAHALFLVVVLGLCVAGKEPVAPPPPAPTAVTTNSPLKSIGPGRFQIGAVHFDKKHKTVQFPATLNMDQGLIEYLIVTESGKTHESLLKTAVEPYHLHLAMLLLGAKGASPNAPTNNTPKPLPGDPVNISLSWKDGDREKICRAEELVFNRETRAAMTAGDWTFNGSRVAEGTFLAQRDGSIVAVITDSDALLNNPRPGHENDEIWEVHTNRVPPVSTRIEVTIQLKPGEPALNAKPESAGSGESRDLKP